MSAVGALDDLADAISTALDECPAEEVLTVITSAFVSLTVECCRRAGHDASRQITIDGGEHRDITIHAEKASAKKGGA